MTEIKNDNAQWKAVFLVTIFSSYFLVLMEWLFFVTKPSFMSALTTRSLVEVLVLGPLPLLIPAVTIAAVFFVLSRPIRHNFYRTAWLSIARLIPTVILTILFLLLVDNFTLTLFGFGIRSTGTLGRMLYLLLLTAAFAAIYFRIVKARKLPAAVAGVLLGASILAFLFQAPRTSYGELASTSAEELPNILLLSTDGLNSAHMSLYGYRRETTPFLDGQSNGLLICENSFANAGATGGSLVSVLTGRLPTETRLIYPPDILRGQDIYRHLPLLLRQFGYRSIQLTMRHYADAYDSNMREAFDSANFREPGDNTSSRVVEYLFPQEIAYFWEQLRDRNQTRLLHLMSGTVAENVFETVTQAKGVYKHDVTSIQELFSFFEKTEEPVFAQIHLIGTHGSRFRPRNRLYSEGQEQTKHWMIDFYDDAIRDFDHYVLWIFAWLRNHKKLDNTLVVIYSDHGMKFTTHARTSASISVPRKSPCGPYEGQRSEPGHRTNSAGFPGSGNSSLDDRTLVDRRKPRSTSADLQRHPKKRSGVRRQRAAADQHGRVRATLLHVGQASSSCLQHGVFTGPGRQRSYRLSSGRPLITLCS